MPKSHPLIAFHLLPLLLALIVSAASAAPVPAISGWYKVVNATDLGADVRVTLSVRLTNPADNLLLISQAGILSVPPSSPAVDEVPVSLNIERNSSASFTQDFTIPKAAYELWRKGVRPRLVLQVQPADGDQARVIVSLTRTFGAWSQLP